MSNRLVEFFYPLPDLRQSSWSLLGWWESRRPAYNLVVGAAGAVTLTLGNILLALPPHPGATSIVAELPVILTYAVLANVCYSGGFVTEWLLRKFMGPGAPRPGPALWRMGLTVSAGITLFPVALAGIDWLIRIAKYWLF